VRARLGRAARWRHARPLARPLCCSLCRAAQHRSLVAVVSPRPLSSSSASSRAHVRSPGARHWHVCLQPHRSPSAAAMARWHRQPPPPMHAPAATSQRASQPVPLHITPRARPARRARGAGASMHQPRRVPWGRAARAARRARLVVHGGLPRGGKHILRRRAQAAVQDVVVDGVVEEHHVLRARVLPLAPRARAPRARPAAPRPLASSPAAVRPAPRGRPRCWATVPSGPCGAPGGRACSAQTAAHRPQRVAPCESAGRAAWPACRPTTHASSGLARSPCAAARPPARFSRPDGARLRHDADRVAQALQAEVADVVAADAHGAAARVIEAEQQPQQRALAAAAGAHHRAAGARRDAQRQPLRRAAHPRRRA